MEYILFVSPYLFWVIFCYSLMFTSMNICCVMWVKKRWFMHSQILNHGFHSVSPHYTLPVFCSCELSEHSSLPWKIWRSVALSIVYTVCAVRAATQGRALSQTSLISMRTLSKLQIHLRFRRWCLLPRIPIGHLTIVRDSPNTLPNTCLIWPMRLVYKDVVRLLTWGRLLSSRWWG